MPGYAETINAVATDTSLPKQFDHPDMSDGTILLFDPNHQYGSFSGNPANNDIIPNVAARNMKKIYALSDDIADLGMFYNTVYDTNGFLTTRSTKNGLIGLSSQVNQTTNANYGILRPGNRVKQEIFNRIPDDVLDPLTDSAFFISTWTKSVRGSVSGLISMSARHLANAVSSSSTYAWHTQASPVAVENPVGTAIGSVTHANDNATAFSFASGTYKNTKPVSYTSTDFTLFANGQSGGWANTTNRNKCSSSIIYRVIIEDLKYCKRANNGLGGTLAEEYAAAVAANAAAFNKAFNIGGSLYGDTWLDVTTFP